MPFRFVHAADVHLDSPLRSLAMRDPELANLVGDATRRAFATIVDLCLDQKVDALLLSGDLYDGEQTSMKTARFLAGQMGRLHAAGIRAFVIRGNHDALSRITTELVLPESVKIFGGRAEAIPVPRVGAGPDVVVHGLSFSHAHAPESLLPKYKDPVEGAVNVGLMHTSLGGSPSHDPYAPTSIADLAASGFRYWALGHVHARSVTTGRCTIVMAGMPQGRDIGESGPKTASVVTVRDDGSIAVEEHPTGVAQFERVAVDLDGVADWRAAVEAIGAALAARRGGVRAEHLIARLTLSGATPLAWRIRRDADLLRAEAGLRAEDAGRTWIDKIEIAVTPLGAQASDPTGALDELRTLIRDQVLGSPGYQGEIIALMEELRGHLPRECRDAIGTSEAAQRAIAEALAREGCEDVLARLRGRGDDEAA